MITAVCIFVTLFSLLYLLPNIIRGAKGTSRAFVGVVAQPVGGFVARQAREWRDELVAALRS